MSDDVPADLFYLRASLAEENGWEEEGQQETQYASRLLTEFARDPLPAPSSRQEARQAQRKGRHAKAGAKEARKGRKEGWKEVEQHHYDAAIIRDASL